MNFKMLVKKLARRWAGLEIKGYTYMGSDGALIQKCLVTHGVRTVIDVGASEGGFARSLREHGYRGDIHSFEPLRDAFGRLERATRGDPRWRAHRLAAGSAPGRRTINVAANGSSSSLLPVSRLSTTAEPESRFVRSEEIEIVTLDHFFLGQSRQVHGPVMLKIDVQGYEDEVLRGADALLRTVDVVQVELSFVPLYEGGPLYAQMLRMLEALGYHVYTIIPGFRSPSTGAMLQADAIFVRNRE